MTTSQSNETLTQNFIRAFTQRGGPSPANELRFAGVEEQYLMVGDVTVPDRGTINPINVNDPHVRGAFIRTGVTIEAPGIPQASLTFKQSRGGVPWYRFRLNCPINVYESIGWCADPADPKNGWASMLILSQGLATDKTYQGRTPFDGSDETLTEVAFTWMGGAYEVGPIPLGETASVEVTTEVVDVVYGSRQNCSNCGMIDDGSELIYALQQTAGGSSAVNAKVLYSTDGGSTWTASTITGLGVGALATAIDLVGQYLVVLVASELAYYVSQINQYTGAPGSWTKVTTGFVAAKNPNDMFVAGPNRVYFVGNGGYIYVSTDILAGVTVLSAGGATTNNLARIHGNKTVLVTVGASNTVLKSINRGETWAAPTTAVTGTHQAVAVKTDLEWWIGESNGDVNYTLDGGESWNTLALPGAAVTGIHDIVWATAECGYIAATRTGPAGTVFATVFGGREWVESVTSRLPNSLTYGRPNRLAVPLVSDPGVAAGNLAVAGLAGNLTDGVVYVGKSPVL